MARSRRRQVVDSERLVLDSGAVIALSRGEKRARAFLERALELNLGIEIPVVVVAETLRGKHRDPPVHRILKTIGHVPDTRERHGRIAGRLLGTTGSTSTIDALVVAQAIEAGGAQILTGDPGDLERLSRRHPEVSIESL
jgi:predicted nucleic acid-binding protein